MSEPGPAALDETVCRPLDLVEELRLRRWARRNYVPADIRAGEWHPVVLDEMLIKDGEIRPVATARSVAAEDGEQGDGSGELSANRRICARYAPLPPTQLAILHDGHELPAGPNMNPAAELSLVEWPR